MGMRAAAIGLAVTAAGCNSLLGLDPTSQRDDDDGGTTIADAAGTTDALPGWDTVIQIEIASTDAAEDDPSMGPGGLELYWSVTVGGVPKDIFRATRMDEKDEFVVYASVIDLNSVSTDATVRISADGETLYMSSDRALPGDLEIFTAARSGPSWTGLAALGEPYSSMGDDHGAAHCLSSSHVFVATDREGGDFDILEISEDGAVYAVATAADEISPFATEDCLTLYFAADLGDGSQDIYVVQREDPDAGWSEPVRVHDLSSGGASDQDLWISADGRTALFASDRGGTWDIWRATR